MIILADTGVLLRLCDRSDPLHPIIDSAVERHRKQGEKVAYTLQNAAEFWNTCTRPKSARGGLGLDITETSRRLDTVELGFSLLADPQSLYSTWRRLVQAHAVRGKQVHDARLVALMNLYGITHILTLNGVDFARYPGIVVVDPTSP